jgi:hypothetical protein
MADDPDREERERRRRARAEASKLPAGLEDSGRDEELVHDPEVQPSGTRADHRHSAPGTRIPGAPQPAAAGGEWERIERATGAGGGANEGEADDEEGGSGADEAAP